MKDLNEPCSVERRFNAFAKRIDSCQVAQSAQTGMHLNVSLSLTLYFIDTYLNISTTDSF